VTRKLSPIVSEFETQEQAESYDRWFRTKVEASINSTKPKIPHDEVMAGARKIIVSWRRSRTSSAS
jgi:hypothetical protein